MYRLIGQVFGLFLGSVITPGWYFFDLALSNYFNFQRATLGGDYLIQELHSFTMMLEAYPQDILQHLVPLLLLIIICNGVFVGSVSFICGWATDLIAVWTGLKPDTDHSGMFFTPGSGTFNSPWTLYLNRN